MTFICIIGHFEDDDIGLQLPEHFLNIFAFLFIFVHPAEIYATIALICTRKQQTEGFW